MSFETQKTNSIILLVNNGSTRVEAAVQLRDLARSLSNRSGVIVHAVSLKHSDQISPEDVTNKLDGINARTFTEFLTEKLIKNKRAFIVIPLFFGESRALTSFIPDEQSKLEQQFGSFELRLTEVLYPLPKGEPVLIDILHDHALKSAKRSTADAMKNLVLVDHGSPLPAVTAVRQHIATSLNAKLPNGVIIDQAVMERRKGKEYDFNGELLEDYLNRLAQSGETKATVLLLFLLAGTHAGENGDIVQICHTVMKKYPSFNVSVSPLVGQNEQLIELLSQRINSLNYK